MLLYSSVLKTTPELTKDTFVQLIEEWNNTHSHKENQIIGLCWNGEANYHMGTDDLWIRFIDHASKGIMAVRYEKHTDGAIWDTDYVLDYIKGYITVQLSRSFSELQIDSNQQFSAPYFMTLLIDRGYIEADCNLPVTRMPIELDGDKQTVLQSIILGSNQNNLPVVFVSKTHENTDPFDVNKLASRLKGIAHVIVEKDVTQCFNLRNLCAGKEEYWGDVGVYFPTDHGHRRLYYRPASDGYGDILYDDTLKAVYGYATLQVIAPLYTWYGVKNDVIQERAERLRAEKEEARLKQGEAEDELTAYIDTFTIDEHELENLREENSQLRTQLQSYRVRAEASDTIHIENKRLSLQIAKVQEYIPHPSTPLTVAQYYMERFGDKIGFTKRALQTLEECNTSSALLWDCFYDMATKLRDLYQNETGDITSKFNNISQFSAARGEGKITRSDGDLMKLRKDTYNGEEIDCESHIKKGTRDKDSNSVRVYYAYSSQQKLIIVSFCNGGHLENASTRLNK